MEKKEKCSTLRSLVIMVLFLVVPLKYHPFRQANRQIMPWSLTMSAIQVRSSRVSEREKELPELVRN